MTEQEQCEFMKWAAANYDIKGDPYENAKAAYLAARRTQDAKVRELVEAVLQTNKADILDWQYVYTLAAQLKEQDQPRNHGGQRAPYEAGHYQDEDPSCPGCGGPTEISREVPPSPYYCEKCKD